MKINKVVLIIMSVIGLSVFLFFAISDELFKSNLTPIVSEKAFYKKINKVRLDRGIYVLNDSIYIESSLKLFGKI